MSDYERMIKDCSLGWDDFNFLSQIFLRGTLSSSVTQTERINYISLISENVLIRHALKFFGEQFS